MPGFGQLINRKYVKGLFFIFLEVLINVQSKLNVSIIYSFQGNVTEAIRVVDYQWLMFYPCVYLFAMWDGYRDALLIIGKEPPGLLFLPFVVSAYTTTIGLIYSSKSIMGITLGPIFQPILSIIIGFLIGIVIRRWIANKMEYS